METLITAATVCRELGLSPPKLEGWIKAGLVEPTRTDPQVEFSREQIRRIWSIMSLERDLDVNMPGIEIILEMRAKIHSLQLALQRSCQKIEHLDRVEQFRLEVYRETHGPADWDIDLD